MSEAKEDYEGGEEGIGEGDFMDSKGESEEKMSEPSQTFNAENAARVTFTPAKVKHVISHHKSSILADDGPVVSLSSQSKERLQKVFHSVLEGGDEEGGGEDKTSVLAANKVAEVLTTAEVTSAEAKLVESVVEDMLDSKLDGDELDVDAMCSFAERFQNPSFEYGQRLRRYAGRGCADEVQRILVRGCNANTADGEGLTALHYACEFNKLDVIRVIREVAGESLVINAQCKYGWTPLHCAAHHGNSDCVDMLLEMDAGLEVPSKELKTALHMAAGQGRVEICQKLLSAGAEINAVDKHKMTAFHDAAYKGHAVCYRALVAAGADVSILDELGNSAESYLEDRTGMNASDDALDESMEEVPHTDLADAGDVAHEAGLEVEAEADDEAELTNDPK